VTHTTGRVRVVLLLEAGPTWGQRQEDQHRVRADAPDTLARRRPADGHRAAPPLAAELLHAGADPNQLRFGDAAPVSSATDAAGTLVLRVTTGEPPDGARVVASFGGLTVVDPRPVQPMPEPTRPPR
jgi:hypothetical protein